MQQADWSPRTGTSQRQTVARGQLDANKTCTPVKVILEACCLPTVSLQVFSNSRRSCEQSRLPGRIEGHHRANWTAKTNKETVDAPNTDTRIMRNSGRIAEWKVRAMREDLLVEWVVAEVATPAKSESGGIVTSSVFRHGSPQTGSSERHRRQSFCSLDVLDSLVLVGERYAYCSVSVTVKMGRRPARCYRYCKNKPFPKSKYNRAVRHVFEVSGPFTDRYTLGSRP